MDQTQAPPGAMMQKCGCPHHKVLPIFVVLLGLLFLLRALGVVTMHFVDVGWPILVIAAGLTKMFSHKCRCYWRQ